jgi:hypothetical protein
VLVWLISPERSPPMSYSSLSGGVLPLFSVTSAKDPAVGALTRVGSSYGLGRPSGPCNGTVQIIRAQVQKQSPK